MTFSPSESRPGLRRRLSATLGALALAAVAIAAVPSRVSAEPQILTMDLNYKFSGDSPAESTALSLTLQDVTGGVQLTLQSFLTGQEFVGDDALVLNFNSALDLSKLGFTDYTYTQTGTSAASLVAATITKDADNISADGGGYYDINLGWDPSLKALQGGGKVSYLLTYSGSETFNVNSFAELASPHGGNGVYYAATHVQGIGSSGSKSGWIGNSEFTVQSVPEPATIVLVSLAGVMGLGYSWRYRKATA